MEDSGFLCLVVTGFVVAPLGLLVFWGCRLLKKVTEKCNFLEESAFKSEKMITKLQKIIEEKDVQDCESQKAYQATYLQLMLQSTNAQTHFEETLLNANMKVKELKKRITQSESEISELRNIVETKHQENIELKKRKIEERLEQYVLKFQNGHAEHKEDFHIERNLTCSTLTVCEMQFDYQCELNQHLETHGKKVYECSECKHKFAQKFNLTAHVKNKCKKQKK